MTAPSEYLHDCPLCRRDAVRDRIVGMKDGDVRILRGTVDVAVTLEVTVLLPGAAGTVTVTEAYHRAEAAIKGEKHEAE